jgi:hypothetical protein
VTEPAKKLATYRDVQAAPPHMIAELIDGELRLQPRPAKYAPDRSMQSS